MSLEHIIMGMLHKPATGYDLRQDFAAGARHFWSAELGQIYPALAGMEQKGWLKSKREASEKGPQRRVYRRTAKGTKELLRWLSGEPIMGVERFAYLAQLIFMGELHDLEKTERFLLQLRAKQASLLSVIRNGLQEIAATTSGDESRLSNEDFHAQLCLQLSARAVGARVQWCDEAVEMVRRRASQNIKHEECRP